MTNYTPNYNLGLPIGSENYSLPLVNENTTKIDTALHNIQTAINNMKPIKTINGESPDSNGNFIIEKGLTGARSSDADITSYPIGYSAFKSDNVTSREWIEALGLVYEVGEFVFVETFNNNDINDMTCLQRITACELNSEDDKVEVTRIVERLSNSDGIGWEDFVLVYPPNVTEGQYRTVEPYLPDVPASDSLFKDGLTVCTSLYGDSTTVAWMNATGITWDDNDDTLFVVVETFKAINETRRRQSVRFYLASKLIAQYERLSTGRSNIWDPFYKNFPIDISVNGVLPDATGTIELKARDIDTKFENTNDIVYKLPDSFWQLPEMSLYTNHRDSLDGILVDAIENKNHKHFALVYVWNPVTPSIPELNFATSPSEFSFTEDSPAIAVDNSLCTSVQISGTFNAVYDTFTYVHDGENAGFNEKIVELSLSDVSFVGSMLNIDDKFDALETKVNQAFQLANDGKTAIANAVDIKGVPASPSDTFPTLATKIGQIQAYEEKTDFLQADGLGYAEFNCPRGTLIYLSAFTSDDENNPVAVVGDGMALGDSSRGVTASYDVSLNYDTVSIEGLEPDSYLDIYIALKK